MVTRPSEDTEHAKQLAEAFGKRITLGSQSFSCTLLAESVDRVASSPSSRRDEELVTGKARDM